MDSVTVELDMDAFQRAVENAENLAPLLEARAASIAQTANAMGAGNPTQETVRWATGEHVGGTRPEYGHDVRAGRRGPVGIVMTRNYAAMKDNHENNTLLKAKG